MKKLLLSIGLALVAFAVLSALNVIIFRGTAARYRLESRNDSEQTMNVLFASLRDYDDFGTAIENIPILKQKIIGIGVYERGGRMLYSWGSVPATFTSPTAVSRDEANAVRMYLENARNDSLILLLRPLPMGPPPPPPDDRRIGGGRHHEPPPFFATLRKAEVVYLEIRQPEFWRRLHFTTVLFPAVEIALAGLIAFMRLLILRNGEYKRRIEQQKNLVVLGTAASTLAHEIKNPLLAIRLQTSILERTLPEEARRELGIINDEVERLSMLSHRVNDYLRDPAGRAIRVDPREIVGEVGARLCSRDLVRVVTRADIRVLIDPERLRSIMENLLQNAFESGGEPEEIAVEIGKSEGTVMIDVLDRGAGFEPGDKARAFDPFFTTKSRGSGIGLAIARRFVVAAGGTIAIEDRPGGGSRLRVVLPEAGPGDAMRDNAEAAT